MKISPLTRGAILRRSFLSQFAAGAAAAMLGPSGSALAYSKKRHSAPSPPNKLDRIAISTWSLHNYFRSTRESTFSLPGPMLALLDVPEMLVDRYRVHHFELCASHFPSTEQAYLRELKYVLVHTQSTVVHLSIDIDPCGSEGTFSDPDRGTRLAALESVQPWVDLAHTLGAKSVSVGPGKTDPENLARTAESYKALATYALARGVHVIVENQIGFGAEHPEELASVINLPGPGRIGALPDFANFTDEAARAKGLKLLFPLAPTVCHVSATEFDAGRFESAYDFSQAIEIARQSGFHGIYSIKFDGPDDPYTGIQKTLDELLKYL